MRNPICWHLRFNDHQALRPDDIAFAVHQTVEIGAFFKFIQFHPHGMAARDPKVLPPDDFADDVEYFAVLVAMINPYTRMIYLLDELYEKRQAYMTVKNIGPFIVRTMDELYIPRGEDDDWHLGYDEAATWFANEMI